jgi:acetyl esterase/lipase
MSLQRTTFRATAFAVRMAAAFGFGGAQAGDPGQPNEPAQRVPGVKSEDVMVDGAVGKLPARVFTPEGGGPFPVVVYFHGGGWVIASHTSSSAWPQLRKRPETRSSLLGSV